MAMAETQNPEEENKPEGDAENKAVESGAGETPPPTGGAPASDTPQPPPQSEPSAQEQGMINISQLAQLQEVLANKGQSEEIASLRKMVEDMQTAAEREQKAVEAQKPDPTVGKPAPETPKVNADYVYEKDFPLGPRHVANDERYWENLEKFKGTKEQAELHAMVEKVQTGKTSVKEESDYMQWMLDHFLPVQHTFGTNAPIQMVSAGRGIR